MPKDKVRPRRLSFCSTTIPTSSMRKSSFSPQEVVSSLHKIYSNQGNPKIAAQQQKYMRSQFVFFGITALQRRALSKEVLSSHMNRAELWALLDMCWKQKERDMQNFGCDVAIKHRQVLAGTSLIERCDSIVCLKKLITTKSWWDTVDMLASNVLGYFITEYQKELDSIVNEWVASDNMWLRRSVILYQLKYKDKTDQDSLFRYCLACCHEKDFFIQKAIGWALREYHKTNPEAVKTFVRENKSKFSALSQREALKHCK